jgi:hypothetical protein
MTVIRPNSITGVTSITAQGDTLTLHSSDGTLLNELQTNINASSGVSTVANLDATNINITGISTVANLDGTNINITDLSQTTTGIALPQGTTAQRPLETIHIYDGIQQQCTGVLQWH